MSMSLYLNNPLASRPCLAPLPVRVIPTRASHVRVSSSRGSSFPLSHTPPTYTPAYKLNRRARRSTKPSIALSNIQ